MDAALASGLEGVVCKRTNSPYQPGRRSEDWVKVRGFRTQEVVVGGYTPGKGSRAGGIGALIVGIPGEHGLGYAGKVGTGFSDADLKQLAVSLQKLRRKTSPFAGELPKGPDCRGHLGATEPGRRGPLQRLDGWGSIASAHLARPPAGQVAR